MRAAVRPGVTPPVPDPEYAKVPVAVERALQHPEKVGHPDGVPHDIVGRVAVACFLVAGIGVLAYFAFGIVIACLIGVVCLWALLRGTPRKARIERTVGAIHAVVHPEEHEHRNVADAPRGDQNA
ncbi:MAG TPA: hypothetical protein VHE35_20900 [Kofleriaceae bacterium]|nr:hypothetical protein [Kofleriaceae bacterium]